MFDKALGYSEIRFGVERHEQRGQIEAFGIRLLDGKAHPGRDRALRQVEVEPVDVQLEAGGQQLLEIVLQQQPEFLRARVVSRLIQRTHQTPERGAVEAGETQGGVKIGFAVSGYGKRVDAHAKIAVHAVAVDIRRARERHRTQAISLDTGFLDRDRFRGDLELADRKTEAAG